MGLITVCFFCIFKVNPSVWVKNLYLATDCLSVLSFWVVAEMAAVITGDVVKKSHWLGQLCSHHTGWSFIPMTTHRHPTHWQVSIHQTCNLLLILNTCTMIKFHKACSLLKLGFTKLPSSLLQCDLSAPCLCLHPAPTGSENPVSGMGYP